MTRTVSCTGTAKTLSDAIDSYEARRRARLGRTSRLYLDRWRRTIGSKRLSTFTSDVINDMVDERLGSVGAPTVRRELNTLMSVLRHAESRGWWTASGVVERPDDGEPRLRWLNDAEVEGLLGAADSPLVLGFMQFLVNTGARCGEAVSLVWKDVDVGAGQVVLRTRKRKGGRVAERRIPVNGAARTALEEAKAFLGGGPDDKVWPWSSAQAVTYWMDKAAKKAGVSDFSPHDLRRTFATRLLMNGVNPRVVADLLGHTSLTMVMRYMQPNDRAREDAVASLGR